jgi:Ca2+-transporting ATPase
VIELVHDNLATFANLQGGQLRSSSFIVKSRQARLHEEKHVLLYMLVFSMQDGVCSMIDCIWCLVRKNQQKKKKPLTHIK